MAFKFPTWAKVAAGFGITYMASCGAVRYIDGQANKALAEKTQSYNGKEIATRLKEQRRDSAAEQRLLSDMDIHTAFQFYCGPKISKSFLILIMRMAINLFAKKKTILLFAGG